MTIASGAGTVVCRSALEKHVREVGNTVARANTFVHRAVMRDEKMKREDGVSPLPAPIMIFDSRVVYLRADTNKMGAYCARQSEISGKNAEKMRTQFFIACRKLLVDCVQCSDFAYTITGEIGAVRKLCAHVHVSKFHAVGKNGIPQPVNDNRRETNPYCPGSKEKKHKASLERLRASQSRRASMDAIDHLTRNQIDRMTGQSDDDKSVAAELADQKMRASDGIKGMRARTRINSRRDKRKMPDSSRVFAAPPIIRAHHESIMMRVVEWIIDMSDTMDIRPGIRSGFYNGGRPAMVKAC